MNFEVSRPGFASHTAEVFAIVEIQRFATFRQMIGTHCADQVMQDLRRRIEATISRCEIGRVGRSTIEFAMPSGPRDHLEGKFEALVAVLETRVVIDGACFDPRPVIGVARRSGNEDEDLLLDQAAAALEDARSNHVTLRWAEDIDSLAQATDLTLMRDLVTAIDADSLALYYQPKLDTRSNRIVAVEALLRWPRVDAAVINIERLVRLSEETGAIRDLTYWGLNRALCDQLRLAHAGHDLRIDVNISGVVLPDPAFAERAIEMVGDALIGFEITETAVIADPDAALANLRAFSEAGIHIAIDDYGSGLSSLAYLKQLPAQELKIDRMFVSGLVDSHRDPLLVRSSIDLAHALEMEITAEGVDNPMALSLLRIMGCDLAQGYLIAPPMSFDDLVAFLRDEDRMAVLEQSQIIKCLNFPSKQVS